MTRWLQAARGAQTPATQSTELTKPQDLPRPEGVLSAKSVLSKGAKPDPAKLAQILDLWSERAAICEYEAGHNRTEAETAAAREIGLQLAHLHQIAQEAQEVQGP